MEHPINLNFAVQTDTRKIIKIVGVGGGGGNAVSHMYRQGIHDVSFVLCNTDEQALMSSEVPVKICLGRQTTKGRGAGNKPGTARDAAKESENDIRSMLGDGTQMVFITAGMGGGTGTGAAPVIAKIAKNMGILTVGIVTIPFLFEGRHKLLQALNGVEEMRRNVDALLVINNARLSGIFKGLTRSEAFAKADDTLSIAAKSIAEIITLPGEINLDFADVYTTMKDGGVALMNNGYGEGESRLEKAINDAFLSPLLNNDNVFNAKKILFNISSSKEAELAIEESDYLTEFMARFGDDIEVIWGTAFDDSLGKKIKFTVLATGFNLTDDAPENLPPGDERSAEEIRFYQKQLIRKYYGNTIDRTSEPAIAILTLEEMENETIVKMIEDNPTYRRSPSLLEDERNKIALDNQRHTGNPESPDNNSKIISGFN
jgi:cell division protein FtsZ